MRDLSKVEAMIKRHEGLSLISYRCPTGYLTIGYGRNIETTGISKNEAESMLKNDLDRCLLFLEKYEWYQKLNDARKDVLISMVFNMGETKFLNFKKLILAIHMDSFDLASKEMISSKWFYQVGNRAKELSLIMKSGTY